jgi:uncharacterized protein YeaO (DUF488 family)
MVTAIIVRASILDLLLDVHPIPAPKDREHPRSPSLIAMQLSCHSGAPALGNTNDPGENLVSRYHRNRLSHAPCSSGVSEMGLRISTYAYGDRRQRNEGLRIGCARYLPRGVSAADYARRNMMDIWLPVLAPSAKLLKWALQREMDDPKVWNAYARRYRSEMKNTNARQTIRLLAAIAQKTPISLGCHCRGTMHCHRFELERLIRSEAR